MLFQITPDTDLSLTIVQFSSVAVGIIGAAYAWFKLNSKTVDNAKEIKQLKHNLDNQQIMFEKALTKIEKDFEEKMDKLEETSKTFYKQLDARYEKIELTMQHNADLMSKIMLKLEVHLANCQNNHK